MADAEHQLHGAVRFGSIADVKQFLSAGHSVNEADPLGMTPLHWASYHGRHKIAALLIARGAEVNAKDASGESPLHYAATRLTSEMAELLVRNKADVNATDALKQTPLHYAATWNGNTKPAALLLANGAKVNALDVEGKTPWDLADDRLFDDLAALLRSHGAVSGGTLKRAQ